MNKIITLVAVMSLGINLIKAPVPFEALSVEQRAERAGMTTEEFILISSVTEAESDRSAGSTEGRVMIALTILNRVNDPRFPDSIEGVLTQQGQFSTVRNGCSVTPRSDLSDMAVIEAVEWLEAGDAPEVLFFNCVGYNYGEPYGYIGGNYFMTLEANNG